MKNKQHLEIEQLAKELRLPAIRNTFLEKAQLAAKSSFSFEDFLLDLLKIEAEQRYQKRIKNNLRRAYFPANKYLNGLDIAELPQDAQDKIPALSRLDFIRDKQNIILAGNPGTGKTHIAIALGIKACLNGFSVFFTSIHKLVTTIQEAKSSRTLRALENKFEKFDLVICDEFGYVSLDKEAAELIFNHLSIRTDKKSTIVTTNLAFDRWIEIFGDEVLTAAIVDRITHKAILVNMTGQSFRIKESNKLFNI